MCQRAISMVSRLWWSIPLVLGVCILVAGCVTPRVSPYTVARGGVAAARAANHAAAKQATSSSRSGWKVGDWIPGTITLNSLEKVLVMPMQIELSAGTGGMRAKDPDTGELFSGTYHARARAYVGRPCPCDAVLRSDKGNALTVDMNIFPARSPTLPTGTGTARDHLGNAYVVKF